MKKNIRIILLVFIIIILIAGIVVTFKNNTYQVNFYSDGILVTSIETRKNRPITEPSYPIKEGYVFIGWYDQNGEIFNFETKITKNINLTAGWGQITTDE